MTRSSCEFLLNRLIVTRGTRGLSSGISDANTERYSTPRDFGRAPKVFLGVPFLYGMIDLRNSPLPQVLRSLITVRVSQLNGCRFCVGLNSARLLKRGVAPDKIEAPDAWQQSDMFIESERVALEYAEAVTLRCDAIEERCRLPCFCLAHASCLSHPVSAFLPAIFCI